MKTFSGRSLRISITSSWDKIAGTWWVGPSALLISFAGLIAAALLLGDPNKLPWYKTWTTIGLIDVLFAVGIMSSASYVKKRRLEDEDFVVVRVALVGFIIWILATGASAFVGLAVWAADRSPASLGVTVFAIAFLILGLSMSGAPRGESSLSALLLLKRIANWQLLAGSAAIAVLFVQPRNDESFFARHGDNYGFAIAEFLTWLVGAGLLTLMMEPLRFKRDAQPK